MDDDEDDYGDFDIPLDDLDALETLYTTAEGANDQQAGLSKGANGHRQATLWGARPAQAGSGARSTTFGNHVAHLRTLGPAPRTSNGLATETAPAPKVVIAKVWDKTAFVKSGFSKRSVVKEKQRKRGKGRAYDGQSTGSEAEEGEPDPAVLEALLAGGPLPLTEMKVLPDRQAMKTWIYPINKPLRSYQYNAAAKALYTNVLCSLPTGLGKTFIAAVVMLNFYRWFPKGKIIFMAPTRPLVTQQIEACHGIVGIPASDAIDITGSNTPALREKAWQDRRVFYATPQVVTNDLIASRLDPTDIVCIIIDEAHRASGDYAYCGVVRYLMSRNPHFRVLALTATPGSKPEAVQNVVDNLHIGHIEVRTDDSIDIQQYVHKKDIDLQRVPLDSDLKELRDTLGALIAKFSKPVQHLFQIGDPTLVKVYPLGMRARECYAQKQHGLGDVFSALALLARAMSYLLEESVSACIDALKESKSKAVKTSPQYSEVLRLGAVYMQRPDYCGHPKMAKLLEMILEHFENAAAQGEQSTRVMVFCSFRAVVEEIVQSLNRHKPKISATRFVGQSTDKKGARGFTQKEQQKVLNDFKAGTFNTLIATSVGEEGLDIGEVDLIVCYEAISSPIRTLQRIGRTGRARDGGVIVLMAEGREEVNWTRANENYKTVQNAILAGKVFELYADCQRLVPADINPTCEKKSIQVGSFSREAVVGPGALAKRPVLKERPRDSKKVVPEEAKLGFITASGKAISRPSLASHIKESMATASQQAYLSKKWQGRTATAVKPWDLDTYQAGKPRKPFAVSLSRRTRDLAKAVQTGYELSKSDSYLAWEAQSYEHFRLEDVNWWDKTRLGQSTRSFVSCRRPKSIPTLALVPEGLCLTPWTATPAATEPEPNAPLSEADAQSTEADYERPLDPLGILSSDAEEVTKQFTYSDDDDEELPDVPMATVSTRTANAALSLSFNDNSIMPDDSLLLDADVLAALDQVAAERLGSDNNTQELAEASSLMPPPPVPASANIQQTPARPLEKSQRARSTPAQDSLDDSMPVVRRRRIVALASSPIADNSAAAVSKPLSATTAPVALKRLRRHDDTCDLGDLKPRKKAKKDSRVKSHAWAHRTGLFDLDAERDDDEADSLDDISPENSSDREFYADEEVAVGQADIDIYRQSLLSQAPAAKLFRQPIIKPGAFRMRYVAPRATDTPKSAPSEFSLDSFCVDDDESIVYEDSSQT
ncbi:uncharacterized protein L969DRAFT_21389 [Mixia osmundae IAM 14324]|uniref:ATP-dependent DNA helicase n=1 Tax=Mixia osmundae (strain CBS 9802 / IAM 14324 / JCM 22182 / KY 12970) TaxID=764103 RepID=G7E308_MIXOS|nr:uncharacterized protein L969DRAFT_21389 [Mixia osmundae IAM 14324]KEI42522.1 hypothetical protein L969DRAFT_21389 [Mixia osmundae IAM 14324]GAA97189.1 hypothetical protein E5Q_03865 [Mixia osmundae IAM 14324]